MDNLVNTKNKFILQKCQLSCFTADLGSISKFIITDVNPLICLNFSRCGIEFIQWFHKNRVEIISDSLMLFTNWNSVCMLASIVSRFHKLRFSLLEVSFSKLCLITSLVSVQMFKFDIINAAKLTHFSVIPYLWQSLMTLNHKIL